MIEGLLFVAACVGVIDGALWMLRDALGKRRGGRSVFPPTRTVETSDSLPF
jgi:hypothetical protein